MFEQFASFIAHNPIFSGGAALGLTGCAAALLRNVPNHAVALARRNAIVAVEIEERNVLFDWVVSWLDAHPYSKRARSLTALFQFDGPATIETSAIERKGRVVLSPAHGAHVLRYKGRLIWLSRNRGSSQNGERKPATLTFLMLAKDQSVARQLIEEIVAFAKTVNRTTTDHYISPTALWERVTSKPKRDLDSVVLGNGVLESLVDDVRRFYDRAGWYASIGVPHRRGYLIYGPPGTGKTSVMSAIAGEFNLDVYILSLSNLAMTDDSLLERMLRIPSRSAILLEDVDCAFEEDRASKDAGVTFSGLLNALDGVASKDGLALFMTTNFVDRLDPALIRPGRADVKIELGYADADQASRTFGRFFPESREAPSFGEIVAGQHMTPAEIQAMLLRNCDDAGGAFRDIRSPAEGWR